MRPPCRTGTGLGRLLFAFCVYRFFSFLIYCRFSLGFRSRPVFRFFLRYASGRRLRRDQLVDTLDIEYVEQDPYLVQRLALMVRVREIPGHVLQAVHPPDIVMLLQVPDVEAALELFLVRIRSREQVMRHDVFLRREVDYVRGNIRSSQTARYDMVLLVN